MIKPHAPGWNLESVRPLSFLLTLLDVIGHTIYRLTCPVCYERKQRLKELKP